MQVTLTTMDFPTRIHFGAGALEKLVETLTSHELASALVVTDPGVVAAGIVDKVDKVLNAAGVGWTLFQGVQTNPVEADLDNGFKAYQDADADCIIAVGGGAAMDTAKGIRLLASHPGPIGQYAVGMVGAENIQDNMPPLFCVPTTAGTGSEVGRSLVVTLTATGRKAVVFSPHLMPDAAICDPQLTVGLPAHITAATGMDALTHNIEAYLAQGFHPLADAISIRGTAIAARYLPKAVSDGTDLEARTAMMAAAVMGATAFQKGLGACHSLAHALGTVMNLHHGLANALMLPTVLRFNAEAVPERVEDIATALGASGPSYGPDPAERAARRIEELRRTIGLPQTLTEAGVDPAKIPLMVEVAAADGCHNDNPRPVTRGDFQRLFEAAL